MSCRVSRAAANTPGRPPVHLHVYRPSTLATPDLAMVLPFLERRVVGIMHVRHFQSFQGSLTLEHAFEVLPRLFLA